MKSLYKSFLTAILAVVMILSFSFVIGTSLVRANDSTIELLDGINYYVEDGASIRIGLLDDGNGGLVASDYSKNGIKFTAKIDKVSYENLNGKGVTFGMLIMPISYLNKNTTLNESDVFTNEGILVNGQSVNYFETDDLTLSADGSYYYMEGGLENLTTADKIKKFIAVPYLKAEDENGFIIHKIKDFSIEDAVSMTYVAQIESETNENENIVNALQKNYVDNLETDVDVTYAVSYDGENRLSKLATLKFKLGEVISAEDVEKQLLETVGDTVEVLNVFFMADGRNQGSTKIYADGKTKADIIVEYNVKEDEEAYAESISYYVSSADSIILDGNKKVIGNADFANGQEQSEGTYKVYADGKIMIEYNSQKCLLDDNNSDIKFGDIIYQKSFTTSTKVNEKIRGYYENGTDFVVLQDNGTFSKNLTDSGYYGIYFDKETAGFKFYSFMLNEEATETAIDLSADAFSFDFENGKTYSLSDSKVMATKEQYATFANEYKGSYYYPDNGWTSNTFVDTALKTPDTILTFNADGYAVYDGIELYRKSLYLANNEYSKFMGRMMGEKECQYVLFNNNTFKIFMRDVATRSTYVAGTPYNEYKPMMLDGTFNPTSNKVTLEYGDSKIYLPKFELEASGTSVVSTNTDAKTSEIDLDLIYKNLAYKTDGIKQITYLDADSSWCKCANTQWRFTSDKTFRMVCNHGSKDGSYELTPITETYGKINMVVEASAGDADHTKTGEGYYSIGENGTYTLYIHFDTEAIGCYVNLRRGQMDWAETQAGLTSYSIKSAFNAMLGKGTIDAPVSKTFVGNGNELVLENDGLMQIETKKGIVKNIGKGTYNGNDLTYTLIPLTTTHGIIVMHMSDTPVFNINEASKIYTGTYTLDGAYIRISCDFGVLINEGVNLYNEYAGTYTASYTVGTKTYEMTLVLNNDGTFSGTGTDAPSVKNIRPTKDGSATVKYNTYPYSLGPVNRLGTYKFEIIGGVVKIIFDFNVVYADTTVENVTLSGIDAKSGYCAKLIYGRYGGAIEKNYGVPQQYVNMHVFDVYDFASGTLGANSMSVLFDGFTSTPISLTKTAV